MPRLIPIPTKTDKRLGMARGAPEEAGHEQSVALNP